MKVGVLLPIFRADATDAVAAAASANEVGLDGVFAYDHLWPLGTPERPSLAPFPLLALIAARYDLLFVGPLVARVGLVGNDVLIEQFETLGVLAPGRTIVALGTGDRLSEPENLAYGLAHRSAHDRRAMIRSVAGALSDRYELWIGSGEPATNDLARELGAVLNLWNKSSSEVRAASDAGPVSWAGDPAEALEEQLDALRDAGALWAVFSPRTDLARLGRWCRQRAEEQ